MMRRTLLHSFATLLFSLSLWSAAVMAAVTTQVTVVTNVAGALVTETTIWDPATAAAAATTTAQTGFFTTVFTTTNDVGTTVTLTQTVNRATMLPTTTTSTSSTGKTTTTVPTATSSLSSGLYLSTVTTTNDLGTTVTLTQTFTHSSTSATSSASSSVSSHQARPSTDFTEPPVSAVTSLSIDSYITITEGTTSTYTTTRAPTSMWVTVVRQGNTITVQTTLSSVSPPSTVTVASPSVGSIGMGTLTGTVGVIKSAIKKTVSHNEAQHLGMSSFTSILGGLLTVLIWFL
ncbi:ANL_collapsed_G0044500.mRNA.1.CDS.1 [Saccharomyces cerevisiae]|nr:ANL_collapsed_G0044500.mRNA.1.CDS.1 [Saccharomyces cerevisiae]